MTENEAKAILEAELRHHPECSIFYEALSWSILALGEIKKYQALGTVEELRAAIEKQRVKKPYIETEKATGLHEDYDCYECPNCDSFWDV